ncbi:MAG TPA: helix-turn-helix transcriptional regulator [Frankiaceae bacterium]|nr:helix-turn-helix transcriptional regulator [Frankiaceae bacterium]
MPEPEMDQRVGRAFGAWVREVRLRKRLTQTSVAERAAVNVSYLSELESGKHNPTVGLAVRLARALDVKPTQLLARLDEIE